jgi:uncharacterized membrane protein
MNTRTRKAIGVAVLVVGWSIVVVGGVLIATAAATASGRRDERAGLGLAVVMGGLLVVVAGNYVHHRAFVAADSDVGGQPGEPGPGRGGSADS